MKVFFGKIVFHVLSHVRLSRCVGGADAEIVEQNQVLLCPVARVFDWFVLFEIDYLIEPFIAFCFVVNKLNSYLFESNMFTTFMRIESTPQINAAKAS